MARLEAHYGRHAPLPEPLLSRLSALASAQESLRGVYLFTMSVGGAPVASAFGFFTDGPEGLLAANAFLEAADPEMPASIISQDLQAMPLSAETVADIRPFSVILLER